MRKKTARKSLIIMLAIVITITMVPTMAFAGTTTGGCGTNLTWALDDATGTLTITGDGTTMDNYTEKVPSPWNAEKASIKNVVINAPKLTKIGDYAFYKCTNLTTVTLLDSVEIIGERAFKGNTSLANISLSKVKDIGAAAFYGCTALTTAIMPVATIIGNYAFSGCVLLTTAEMPKVETIGIEAFYGCEALKTATMPVAVTIGDTAFCSCTALTMAIMPVATTIGLGAFKGCTELKSAVIKNKCDIDFYAFDKEYIEGLILGLKLYVLIETNGTKELKGDGATQELKELVSELTQESAGSNKYKNTTDGVTFDTSTNKLILHSGSCGAKDKETTLEWTLDTEGTLTITGDGTAMKEYTIPGTPGINSPWENHRSSIKSVDIQASALKNIGDYAFYGCTNLTTVNLPSSVEGIGTNAFEGNTSLASIALSKVTAICLRAFYGCSLLNTVIMPEVGAIGAAAFRNCTALTTAVIPDSCIIMEMAFNKNETELNSGLKLYILTEVGETMKLIGDGNTEALIKQEIQATRESATSTIYKTADGTTFDTTTNQLTPPSTGGGGGYFPPTPTPDPTAPIQPKEQTITNADGTKTTVLLFDGTKSGTPAKGEALLSAEALAKIAAVKGAGAVVATSTSIVQFDQKALQAITGGQTKGNIKVIAEIVSPDTLTPEQKALLGDNALIIDLSVENENGKVTDFNGGTATVVINIPAGVDPTTLGTVYIKTNGKLEKVEGKVVMVNGVATFQFVTNHFSKFAVLDKATIAKAIAAQEAMAKDKLVKGVKATKLTAIKAVAKKSNVTVTWKKSKGYKVDGYQIWKSSKKTTDYKMMAKRTGQKYKNTYGLKSGKTYYYKVRGFREIDGKIVYTKWAQAKVVAK